MLDFVRLCKFYFSGKIFRELIANGYMCRSQLGSRESLWLDLDRKLVQVFDNDFVPLKKRYDFLFSYFISGFLHYYSGTPDLAHVDYPGAPSIHGTWVDDMEGFTRMLPLICSWVSSGRESVIKTIDGVDVDLVDIVRRGLLAGTNLKSSGYWGIIGDYDQRICEAADVALSIWLTRDSLWCVLGESQKQQIIKWLLGINSKKIPDNNWHLFPVLVNEVIRSLGYPYDRSAVHTDYTRIKSFYKGNGWFSDGPQDVYDYYNAWSIHYSLFWIDTINCDFDHEFITRSLRDFVLNYKLLFSPTGFPITGRSICYRMAAPAALIAGFLQDPGAIRPGLARRALDCTWRHFISKGAVANGNVTQGYWKEDLRFLDYYSGPASGLWSLRSLVLAFYCPSDSDFWHAPDESLPVELSDYEVTIPEIRWKIRGFRHSGEVQIIKMDNSIDNCFKIQDYTFLRKIAGLLMAKPFRPNNTYAKHKLYKYSSLHPFVDVDTGHID